MASVTSSSDSESEDSLSWELDSSSSSSGSESEGEAIKFRSIRDSNANPSEVTDYIWVYSEPPKASRPREPTLGEWLIFRPYSLIDETWHMIRKEVDVKGGVLSSITTQVKVSTMLYNPSCGGPGPQTSASIGVFTTADDVDKAGFALIQMLRHDIKYKTEEATLDGEYAWKGGTRPVCLKTLYWNDGKPSFTQEGEICYGPKTRGIKDEWHLNHAAAPDSVMRNSTVYGRWVIELEYEQGLTGMWQFLRRGIEAGKLGPVEMVCPPKLNWRDQDEKPVFLVYTAQNNKEFVGCTLATIAEKDIRYELSRRARRCAQTVYNHKVEWNDGDPVYVMTRNRKVFRRW